MNNGSLVLDLQQQASREDASVASLLRKALLITTKLNLQSEAAWIQSELNGYASTEDLPAYRKVNSVVKALNPYQGMIPVGFPDSRMEKILTHVPLTSSIGHLEQLLNNNNEKRELVYPFSPEQKQVLKKLYNSDFEFHRLVNISLIYNVFETVRNRLLEWALDLESRGILGEGMTFTQQEKNQAMSSKYTINIGSIGNMNSSAIGTTETGGGNLTFSGNQTVSTGDKGSLRDYLSKEGLDDQMIGELITALEAEEREIKATGSLGKKVSDWIGRAVSLAAAGSWDVTVPIASQVIMTGLDNYFGIKLSG